MLVVNNNSKLLFADAHLHPMHVFYIDVDFDPNLTARREHFIPTWYE